jgi:CubicO group peptidase (beta-lactamase class C family)
MSRRERVEHGLLAALQIAGRPLEQHSLLERMRRYCVPGVSIAVIDDGEIAWAGGYGEAIAGRSAAHATTRYQAASISKAVAAVGVLALVEHGAFDLDADVNSLLRSWRLPESSHTADRPVTVRHLLSHTAGTTVPGFPGYPRTADLPSVADILSGRGAANTPAVESFAPPGTVSQYSGGGSTIVQQLIADVTGRDFAEVMSDLVLVPFGMVDSAYAQPLGVDRAARAAEGHGPTGAPVEGGHHVYPELQAAGLWTTVVDLARWTICVQEILRGDRTGPISRATAHQMVTPVDVAGQPGPFGLGPELGGSGPLRRFGHSGSNEGFRSQVDGLVEQPLGAAILTNAEGGTTLMGEIRRAIAAEYGWGAMDMFVVDVAQVDPETLASYAGRYRGPFDRPLTLEFLDGELSSPAPYGRRRMLPLSATRFLDEETGATLEVHPATAGGAHAVERIAVLVGDAELMSFAPVEVRS